MPSSTPHHIVLDKTEPPPNPEPDKQAEEEKQTNFNSLSNEELDELI